MTSEPSSPKPDDDKHLDATEVNDEKAESVKDKEADEGVVEKRGDGEEKVEDDPLRSASPGMLFAAREPESPTTSTPLSRTPSTRRPIELPKKPEVQPWDLVDPPPDNNSIPNGSGTGPANVKGRALIPRSSYYFGPPPSDAAFGTPPIGHIGVHHPREIIRVERDYSGGELIQFANIYPLELDGRLNPTQFLESINAVNELLISAHSGRRAMWDNMLQVFSLQLSRFFYTTHYEKEMKSLEYLIEDLNTRLYNPVGLNILWPRKVAFLFMEIEYY